MDSKEQLVGFKMLVDHLAAKLRQLPEASKLEGLNYLFSVIKPQIELSAFSELTRAKLIVNKTTSRPKLLLNANNYNSFSPSIRTSVTEEANSIWLQFPRLQPGSFDWNCKTHTPLSMWRKTKTDFSKGLDINGLRNYNSNMILLTIELPLSVVKYFCQTKQEHTGNTEDGEYSSSFNNKQLAVDDVDDFNDSEDNQEFSRFSFDAEDDFNDSQDETDPVESFESQIVYETQNSDDVISKYAHILNTDNGENLSVTSDSCFESTRDLMSYFEDDTIENQLSEDKTTSTTTSSQGSNKFICNLCTKPYKKRISLIAHFTSTHSNFCHDCGQDRGSTVPEKITHNKEFHGKERPFVCEQCGENFRRNQQYQAHLTAHSREPKKKYPCPECGVVFAKLLLLRAHVKDTGHKSAVICELCGTIYDNHRSLVQHARRVHKTDHPQFKCSLCSAAFTIKSNMERHVALHMETVKSFVCEICGNAYFTESVLREHVQSSHEKHKSQKYECKVCNRKFVHNRLLQVHAVSHSENRPFVCEECGGSFKLRPHLMRHKRKKHAKAQPKRFLDRLEPNANGKLIPAKELFAKKKKLSTTVTTTTETDVKETVNSSQLTATSLNIPHQLVTQQFATNGNEVNCLPFATMTFGSTPDIKPLQPIQGIASSSKSPINQYSSMDVDSIKFEQQQLNAKEMFQYQNAWTTTNSVESQMNYSGDSSQSVYNTTNSIIAHIKQPENSFKMESMISSSDGNFDVVSSTAVPNNIKAEIEKTLSDSELISTTSDIQLFNLNNDFSLPSISGGTESFDFINSESQAKAIADISDALQKEYNSKDFESTRASYFITQIDSEVPYDEGNFDQMAIDQQGELPQFIDYTQNVSMNKHC